MSRVCKIHGCHTGQDQPDSTAAWISINLSSCKLPSSRWSNTLLLCQLFFSLRKILTPVIHRAYLMLNLWLKTCHHSSWRAISSTFSVDFLLSSWSFHPESGFGKLSVPNNSLTKSDAASQFCNKIISLHICCGTIVNLSTGTASLRKIWSIITFKTLNFNNFLIQHLFISSEQHISWNHHLIKQITKNSVRILLLPDNILL